MILTRRAALGGVQLDELHERIVIRSINPGVPNESIQATARMGGAGQRMTSQHWNQLDVSISYAIDVPRRELELRRQIFEMVNAWALRKGWLTISYLPNRRMYVDKVVVPGSGDLWNWTDEFTITFRAYNVPFWQDEMPTQTQIDLAAGGSGTVEVGGNVESPLDVTFRNRSGMTVNNFSIQAGGHNIRLTGLGLSGSGTLAISHGTDGLLRITADGRSVYDKYTGSDDLTVSPGQCWFSFSADRAGRLTVQSYGRYV